MSTLHGCVFFRGPPKIMIFLLVSFETHQKDGYQLQNKTSHPESSGGRKCPPSTGESFQSSSSLSFRPFFRWFSDAVDAKKPWLKPKFVGIYRESDHSRVS